MSADTATSTAARSGLSRPGGFHQRLQLVSGIGWLLGAMDAGLATFVPSALSPDLNLTTTPANGSA